MYYVRFKLDRFSWGNLVIKMRFFFFGMARIGFRLVKFATLFSGLD